STRQFLNLISAGIATPAILFSGQVFFRPAWKAIRHRQMSMDVPIALAIITTVLASFYELLQRAEHVYFDAAISLIFFLLIGRTLEQGMRKRSVSASENLRHMLQGRAIRLRLDNTHEDILAEDLQVGDRVLVMPGECIPADGILLSAQAYVDESLISGESVAKIAKADQTLIAGCQIVDTAVELRVTAIGSGSRLSKIAALTEAAEAHRGATQLLADKFARAYGPVVIGGALFGFLIWFFVLGAGLSQSLLISVAVLVVTCPCAAGLATPAVVVRAVNLLMSKGVILRTAGALERLAEIGYVFVDKTGTLTTAKLSVANDLLQPALKRAAAMAENSTHPLSKVLAASHPSAAEVGVQEIVNHGLLASDGAKLGSAHFVGVEDAKDTGPTLWFRPDCGKAIRLSFEDTPRADASDLLLGLMNKNLPVTMLSGDTEVSVSATAKKLGILNWHSRLSPERKVAEIESIERSGIHTLMIGDGLNDTPSLAAAHSSMALSSATSVSQSAADIILIGDKLKPVLIAIEVAKKARRLIKQNLVFSLVYNIIALPIALMGGLTPMIAAILMSSSSLIVMINAMRLGR
ncbi:MAG: copper-translocating P-type ATPase, partial [Amylibacter sp.]